jgi:2-(1,2-epoxy-1,2-dihydrophenyl)acetyl-CoA isomerase
MGDHPITVSRENGIAAVTLGRPGAFNAFDLDLARGLADRLVEVGADAAVRGVVISGEGAAFCAGGDLKYIHAYPDGIYAAFRTVAGHFHRAVLEIRGMQKPVVAAINGPAAGGGFSLALACDFRVMARSATLIQAYTSRGLSIDGGGTWTLPRIVGAARALEIAAFDEPIDAEQALAWGLVTRVVADDRVLDDARELAERIAAGPRASFAWSKRLINDSFDTPLSMQLEREREGIAVCGASPDGREGLSSFVEKRKPVFNRSEGKS